MVELYTKLGHQRTVVFLCFSPFIIALYSSVFYPGYLTADSLYMLSQGSGNVPISNWHPPFTTLVWGLFYNLYQSAGGVWLIQISLYIASVIVFCLRLRSFFIALVTYFVLLIYPPVFTNMGALWKDCWVLSTTLFCVAYSISAVTRGGVIYVVLSALFFILSSLIRIDYAIISLPFLMVAIISNFNNSGRRRKVTITIIAVFLGLFLAKAIIETSVSVRLNPWLNTVIWDIAGIEQNAHQDVEVPGYNCSTSDPLVFGQYRKFEINLPQQPLIEDATIEAKNFFKLWLSKVLSNPQEYLLHRICVARSFLGYRTPEVHYPYPRAEMSDSPLTQRADRSQLNISLYWFFDKNAFGLMYRYWYYAVVIGVLFLISIFAKKITMIEAAVFSSVYLSISRFLILPAVDFRYGLWIVVGTIIFISLILDKTLGSAAKENRTARLQNTRAGDVCRL